MKRSIIPILGAVGLCVSTALAQSLVDVIKTGLFDPNSVAVDSTNSYFIVDSGNSRVLKYFSDSQVSTNFAGTFGVPGFADGPGFLAKFAYPQGIATGRGGFVVADTGNHRIRFVAPDGTVSTLAGATKGFVDALGTASAFNSPAGVAVDAAGNIFVADLLNNAVRKIDPANNVTTVATGLLRPSAVAVAPDGTVYIADTGNHSIRSIDGTGVHLIAGSGSRYASGSQDAVVATEGLLNSPRGLLYQGADKGLLISDTGNRSLRRLYFSAQVGVYSLSTVTTDGAAQLVSPVGLAQDKNADVVIVDQDANAVYRLVDTTPQQPVSGPVIGTVSLIINQSTGLPETLLTPKTTAIFDNDQVIAILSEDGSKSFYTVDGSDPSAEHGDQPPTYRDGMSAYPRSLVDPSTKDFNAGFAVTLKAMSTAPGRQASKITIASYRFEVSAPSILGDDPSAVYIECNTRNALVYYTVDGTEPTTDGKTPTATAQLYTLGQRLNIADGTNDVTLKVQAIKRGYASSRAVAQTYEYEAVPRNTIGFTKNYFGGVGSTIIIPIWANLRSPNDIVWTLQFRVQVKPHGSAPLIDTSMHVLPLSVNDFFLWPMPVTDPVKFPISPLPTDAYTVQTPDLSPTSTDMAVAWLGTNAVERGFSIQGQKVVILLAVPIPSTASEGDTYDLSILYPSATLAVIDNPPMTTPVVLTALPTRTITVSNIPYTVGDTALAQGYNAGEFGSGNINNNDLNTIFNASVDLWKPFPGTDVYDAMDAWPEDSPGVPGGDEQIRLLDWQTVLDRSLRFETNNWARSWTPTGVRTANPTTLDGSQQVPSHELSGTPAGARVWVTQGAFSAAQVADAVPGSTVQVPVAITIKEGIEISGLQFCVVVLPVGDAPVVNDVARLVAADGIPTPTLRTLRAGTAAAGWRVGAFSPPLSGKVDLGKIEFVVPKTAVKGQSYVLRFIGIDGSIKLPDNNYANYRFESQPGSVWVLGPVEKAPEVITDEWRARFFGSIASQFGGLFADPDGDGRNNLQEYLEGTNPAKLRFHNLLDQWKGQADGFRLKWFAAQGKTYIVESAPSPEGPWTKVAELSSAAFDLKEFVAPKTGGDSQYYRVREVTP